MQSHATPCASLCTTRLRAVHSYVPCMSTRCARRVRAVHDDYALRAGTGDTRTCRCCTTGTAPPRPRNPGGQEFIPSPAPRACAATCSSRRSAPPRHPANSDPSKSRRRARGTVGGRLPQVQIGSAGAAAPRSRGRPAHGPHPASAARARRRPASKAVLLDFAHRSCSAARGFPVSKDMGRGVQKLRTRNF